MRRLFAKFARTSVKKVVQRERRLGFEACEERQLMTVSPVNFGAIRHYHHDADLRAGDRQGTISQDSSGTVNVTGPQSLNTNVSITVDTHNTASRADDQVVVTLGNVGFPQTSRFPLASVTYLRVNTYDGNDTDLPPVFSPGVMRVGVGERVTASSLRVCCWSAGAAGAEAAHAAANWAGVW